MPGRAPPAQVTLLWKLLPTLERQERGAAATLVRAVQPTTVVATFPTRSRSGRDRGMSEHYRAFADAVLGPGIDATLGQEWVRIVIRGPDAP